MGARQDCIPGPKDESTVRADVKIPIESSLKVPQSSMSTFQAYMSPMINAIRNPSNMLTQTSTSSAMQPTSILSRIRNINSTQMVGAGVVAAEVLGFFTVGQMLGRRKIIGYRTSKSAPDAQVHH